MNAGYLKRKVNGVEKRFYPITHIDAVVNEDGTTIGEQITELNSRVQNIEENGAGGSATEAEDSKKLGGQLPSYYATANHGHTAEDVGALPSNNVLIFNNVTVNKSSIPLDINETYPDYPYIVPIPCPGVTADYYPEVVFDMSEATSGNYSPIAVSDVDKVRVYSKVSDTVTIASVKCVKAV